ncbi:MAG: hypothetical protein C0478_05470 [Planctomyces sp.]|nr:hypothetical protein [Planctomyces sp.]
MRLTLRTLLAYLDDVLPPAAAKALGERIRESEDVQQLVSRIREVIRKRRLGAPSVKPDGTGENTVDANFIAEYLNDLLSPEQVVAIESLCLESDVHLAEVAACHQILTLAAAEPVVFSAASRERLYALVDGTPLETDAAETPAKSAQETAKTVGSSGAGEAAGNDFRIGDSRKHSGIDLENLGQGAGRSPGVAVTSRPAQTPVTNKKDSHSRNTEPRWDEIPQRTESAPWSRRVLPIVAVGVIGVAWLALLARDPALKFGFSGKPSSPSEVASPSAAQPLPVDPNAGEAISDKPIGNPATPANNSTPANSPVIAGVDGSTPPATTPTAEPAPGTGAMIAANTPTTSPTALDRASGSGTTNGNTPLPPLAPKPLESAALPTSAVVPTTAPPAGTSPPQPVNEQAAAESYRAGTVVTYASTEGAVIRRDAETSSWKRITPQQPILPGTVLIVPDPFEARFLVSTGNASPETATADTRVEAQTVQLDVLPGSVVRFGGAVGNSPASLLVERGRVSLSIPQPNPAAAGPAASVPAEWAFQVGPNLIRITPTSADLLAGIEVQWREPTRFEQDLGSNRTTAGLYLAKGSARVTVGGGEARDITQGMFVPLTPVSQQPEHLAANPPISPALPEWLDPASRQPSLAVKRFGTLFEREFAQGSAIDLNMLALVVDARPKMAELAVHTLGLMGRMDGLVEALAKSEHEEARMAAFTMLREWLGHMPSAGGVVKEELANEYAEPDANAVYRLLWGYSPADAKDKLGSQELVDFMGNGRVEIREMAFSYVQKLTGKRLDYRPMDIPGRREAALQKWYGLLQKDGALLPTENPAAPE